ncbi:hypothetical protein GY45DRAFT_1258466 [Cubamyces sp. BRFM 1775]|nr:hypothetical protein GY45DRAFT_1258466 [Cubamyces sp. BRFM 1775]
MNNGNASQTNAYPTNEVVPFAPNSVVTPEDYQANLQRIQKVKAALAFYEQQNDQGLQRFYEERQALEQQIEQGRLAAYVPASLSDLCACSAFPAPYAPVAGPSTASTSQTHPGPAYQTSTTAPTVTELPTSAQIVEVPSPRVDRPIPGDSSGRADYLYRAQQAQPSAQENAAAPQQYVNTGRLPNGGVATPQYAATSSGRVGNLPSSYVGTNRQPYQMAAAAQTAQPSFYRPTQQHQQQFSVPRETQPSHSRRSTQAAPHAPSRHPQPPAPHVSNAGPSRQQHTDMPQVASAPQQPRYGTSFSSLDGALGTASSSAPESVPHAKVTYASRHSARTTQAVNQQVPQPTGVDPRDEQQLFQFFKQVGPATVQKLMVQVLNIVARKQSGGGVSASEEQLKSLLNEHMQQACEVISERLKKHSIVELKELFIKFFNILKIGREQARAYEDTIRDVMQAEHPLPAQPSAPLPNGASPQTASAPPQVQPVASSSRIPASTPSPATAAPPIARPRNASTSQSTPHAQSPPSIAARDVVNPDVVQPSASVGPATPSGPQQQTRLQWYVPRDPTMAVAYRDAQGFIRYMFPPTNLQQPRAVSGTTPTIGTAVPSFVQNASSQARPSPLSTSTTAPPTDGTPEKAQERPQSPWTPEKADRSRLAQDIMRSLGKPMGSFGDPLLRSPTKTTAPYTFESAQASRSNKRKPSAEPGEATPSKRQRAQELELASVPTSVPDTAQGAIPSPEVIDLTSSTSSETVAEPMRTSPDAAPAPTDDPETALAMRASEEPGDTTVTIPAVDRATSMVSTDSTDVEKVQAAMVVEAEVPESVASEPPSSAKSVSPPSVPQSADVVDLPSVDECLFAAESAPEVADASTMPGPDAPSPPPAEPEGTKSVSPARAKVPLFLPSPSSSSGASSSGAQDDSRPAPQDEDVLSDGEAAPRLPYRHKGKGKARQMSLDIDLATTSTSASASPPPSARRPYKLYVAVPPLPAYVRRLREAGTASTSANVSDSEDGDGDGLTLTLTGANLQGTYACRWQTCSHRFSDEAKLARHLRRHAMLPLPCAYEGCDASFNTHEAFLTHYKSSKHRDSPLRRTPSPLPPPEDRPALSPLPDNVPAYLAITRRVARHPISKERHQWLGPKVVLENLTAFKYSGGRSNAALPSRSRRLAEKVAAAELAGVTPDAALEQIKRWIDDEYLSLADGYDASRRPWLRCADIPSQEVTQLVDAGLVLWPADSEDNQKADAEEEERARASRSPEAGQQEEHGADGRAEDAADMDASASGDRQSGGLHDHQPQPTSDPSGVDGEDAGDSEAGGVDQQQQQLAEDVSDGGRPGGQMQTASARAPDREGKEDDGPGPGLLASGAGAGDGDGDAGGGGRSKLPERSSVASDAKMEEAEVVAVAHAPPPPAAVPSPTDRGGGAGATYPWPVWPPPPRRDEDAVESLFTMQSLPGPGYISARSAEVILSDVRPIKLKPEALQSVNVLLDEFLYSILSVSRSLATDKLKAALLKVLPTNLGKEALLEAEVELKAYWERTTSARSPNAARNGDHAQFDLQWSFELLRLKCEAYSTMNDSDEDAEAEKRLQQRMEAAGSSSPPNPALLAPAALYLTAILEAICEHVLSNVSRVAARDSGRTLATVQDLFTALGEDDALYGTVKSMKVFEQIESLSKAQRPRRSKSFSRSTDKGVSRTSTSSPTPSKARMSIDSTRSNAPTVVGSNESRRTSMEKAKAVKIFHSRSLSDRGRDEPAVAGALARSQSEIGINREYQEFEASLPPRDDEELQQEFDELMRSGATMKVSLTPDRLKSMEVYKQERIERERGGRRAPQGAEKVPDGGAAAGEPKRGANGRPPLRHVDSIVEDDEESGSQNHINSSSPTAAPPFQSNAASARMRNTSFTAQPSPVMARANDQRLRSISISNVPHPRHEDGITRKTPAKPSVRTGSQNAMPPPTSQSGVPKRTRKMGRNRESMDLDDIMNGSDGEDASVVADEEPPAAPMPLRSPTSSRGSDPMSPRKPHVSRAAQDLIAFLEAGPPEEPAYNPSMNASVISFESTKTRSGRLQRMMSRLTLGGSKESLSGGSIPEEMGGITATPKTPRSLTRKASNKGALNTPPPSFKASSLASKRSIPDVMGMQPYPNVIVATPPPRPMVHTSSSISAEPPSTTSSSHTSREDVSSQAPSLTRRSTRKAVPQFDETALSPSSSTAQEDTRPHTNGYRNSPDSSTPTSPTVVRKPVPLNGHPVKIDTSEASLHPSRSITSPSSTVDRKSPRSHSKAESGYASRSASRSPVTPSERLPPPPPPPAAPTIPPSEVEDLRRLLGAATSADECRLLVDMFLAKTGLAPKTAATPAAEPVAKSPAATLEDALELARRGDDEIERGLVALFLGGGGGQHVDPSARLQVEDVDVDVDGHEPELGHGHGLGNGKPAAGAAAAGEPGYELAAGAALALDADAALGGRAGGSRRSSFLARDPPAP